MHYSIHLADKPQFTLNVEGGGRENYTKIIAWPHQKGDSDLWYIKSWDDMNI